jgi:hypothetical protein
MEGLEKSGKKREKSGNSFPLLEISKRGKRRFLVKERMCGLIPVRVRECRSDGIKRTQQSKNLARRSSELLRGKGNWINGRTE